MDLALVINTAITDLNRRRCVSVADLTRLAMPALVQGDVVNLTITAVSAANTVHSASGSADYGAALVLGRRGEPPLAIATDWDALGDGTGRTCRLELSSTQLDRALRVSPGGFVLVYVLTRLADNSRETFLFADVGVTQNVDALLTPLSIPSYPTLAEIDAILEPAQAAVTAAEAAAGRAEEARDGAATAGAAAGAASGATAGGAAGAAAAQPYATDAAASAVTAGEARDAAIAAKEAAEDVLGAVTAGAVPAHASTHGAAGSDPLTLAQSQVAGLTADLAAKEPTQTAASQAEAEAGTESTIRKFSPLRIAQAIAVLVTGSSIVTKLAALTGSGRLAESAIKDKLETIVVAVSDETTALTAGTAKVTFRMPFAMTLLTSPLGVRATATTAPAGGVLTVDVNVGGASILSTKLTIDATEKTSTTAATPAVISTTALADDAEVTIDIDGIGSSTAGAGLKVYLIGHRA